MAIALAVVITVVLVHPDNNGNGPANGGGHGSDSEFASANDTEPVAIITEDPTCDAWNAIAREYTGTAASIKWDERDHSVPESGWTPEQRAIYEGMKKALTQATDQTVNLTKATPHRTVRMIYEQFIAYGREFAGRIPSYSVTDNDLMRSVNGSSASLTKICGAIANRSAQATAPRMSAVPAPTRVAQADGLGAPTRLLTEPNPVCSDLQSMTGKIDSDSDPWIAIDKAIPAKDWTPEQKAINEAVAPIMLANADELERLGRKSGDSRFEDLAVLAAQYRRAFVISLPSYTSKDVDLALAAINLNRLLSGACKVAS